MTAKLIKYDIISTEDIWGHLDQGNEDEVQALLDRQVEHAQYHYRQINEAVMNKEAYEAGAKLKVQEQEKIEKQREEMPLNFKVRLLEGLIKVNAWDKALEVTNVVYDGKFDLTLSKELLVSAFKVLDWFIEPLYRPLCKNKS